MATRFGPNDEAARRRRLGVPSSSLPSTGGRLGGGGDRVAAMAARAGVSTQSMQDLLNKARTGTMEPTDMMAIAGVPPVLLPRELGGFADEADGMQLDAASAGGWVPFASAEPQLEAIGQARIRDGSGFGFSQASKSEVLDAVYKKRVLLAFAFYANMWEKGSPDLRVCITSWVTIIRNVADHIESDTPIDASTLQKFKTFVDEARDILAKKAAGDGIEGSDCENLAKQMLRECNMGDRHQEELSWSLAFAFNCESPVEASEEEQRLGQVGNYLK